MNWQIENSWNLLLLGLIPMLIFLLYSFWKWKKTKKNLFAEKKFQSQLFEKTTFFSKIFPILYLLGFGFLILSLIGFITKEKEEFKVEQGHSNILFLVDVSNSMNATDVSPSRLDLAKIILQESLNMLQNEKIGIVVFAGEARSIMPLTTDYSSANLYLENLNSELIQQQGTDFLSAVKEANKKLANANDGAKKIILISDGEDNEGNHNAAIREAKNNSVAITTIGIGTEEGSPIPELVFNYYEDYKRDEYGQVVITKRETSALKSISEETNGKYIDGNNTSSAVNQLVKDIHSTEKTSHQSSITSINTHYYYQWFLGISLLIFFIIYLFNPKRNFDF